MTQTQNHCHCPAKIVKAEGKYHFSVCPGRTEARLAGQVPLRFVRTDGTLSDPMLPKPPMTPLLITVNGSKVTIPEARRLLGIPSDECFGCYLGDASPDAHDKCYLSDD